MKRLMLSVAPALVLAPTAQAHVSLHPNVIPAAQFAALVVRVPNERPDATTEVRVRFPPGFIFVSYAPVPGWTAKIVYRKLAKPVTAFGESHDQEVGDVIWSGGEIASGQFVDFPLSVSVPNGRVGAKLTFKTLQTYSSGEVVRWIGAPSSEAPAPQIALAGRNAPAQDVPAGPRVTAPTSTVAASSGDDDDDDSSTETLAVALGAVGCVAGLAALGVVLIRGRRT